MDVVRGQLEDTLPVLESVIHGCDFLAMDMEFTGLHSSESGQQPSLFDSASDWYKKARKSVQFFSVCQIGLSVFRKQDSNRFVTHSFNFYLFPTTFGRMDSEFGMQASSIVFLSNYDFDFNKFLKEGIPYMNEEQEKTFLKDFRDGNWRVRSSLEKESIKKAIEKVSEWLTCAAVGDSIILYDLKGFQQVNVQLVLRQALPDVWTFPVGEEEVLVRKVLCRQRWEMERMESDPCRKDRILLSALGFTVLFRIIVDAQKPLVGHNMLLDLLHLHEKFYRPLPESYKEFKQNIHTLFPVIIDTKTLTRFVWKELQFPRAGSLLDVDNLLNSDTNPAMPSSPIIEHALDCKRYGGPTSDWTLLYIILGAGPPLFSNTLLWEWFIMRILGTRFPLEPMLPEAEEEFPHEAAYDAFLCGSVLVKLGHLLLVRNQMETEDPTRPFCRYMDVFSDHLNQVNLARASVSRINLEGEDPLVRRPPALLVSVQGWPGVDESKLHREFKTICSVDIKRLGKQQFLLRTTKFKSVRALRREYKDHPALKIVEYKYWKHSALVNCVFRVCGVLLAWSAVAFCFSAVPGFKRATTLCKPPSQSSVVSNQRV